MSELQPSHLAYSCSCESKRCISAALKNAADLALLPAGGNLRHYVDSAAALQTQQSADPRDAEKLRLNLTGFIGRIHDPEGIVQQVRLASAPRS